MINDSSIHNSKVPNNPRPSNNPESSNSSGLSAINVKVEQPDYNTGNLQSILVEIKHALQQLVEQNKEHSIDLKAMPWSPGEEQQLNAILGRGEVSIELNTMGKSTFYETLYSGVWLVNHYNQEDELMAKLIEITRLPGMVFAQSEDINNSLQRLSESGY